MDLVLVRHAEPVRTINASGPADPPLTDLGRRQAAAASAWLAEESFDAIYASPMRRARETAEAIAEPHGLEIALEDGIAEYDRQSEFYIPVEELKTSTDPELIAHWRALAEDRLEDVVEDAATFRPRVADALDRLIAAHPGQRVLAVCHGGVINVALAAVLDLTRSLWFEPAYASIHRVVASRSGVRSLLSLNETGHLRGVV
ncbi:MAG TPA: histidine phosphatase family protein [Actinomycetota bacterium]|nr:histidine phosphatase family protein [Actinomycetota bacterium]